MARRPSPPPEDSALSAAEMRNGIERLNRRIAELEALDPNAINYGDTLLFTEL
jgi:hypothetical protein